METAFKFYVIERDGAVVTVIRSHHQRLAGRDQLVVEKLQSDTAEAAMPSYIPEAWREVGEEPQQWAAWMDAAEKREIKRQADAAARELAQRFGVPAALDRSERTTVIVRATPKFFVSLGGAQYRRDMSTDVTHQEVSRVAGCLASLARDGIAASSGGERPRFKLASDPLMSDASSGADHIAFDGHVVSVAWLCMLPMAYALEYLQDACDLSPRAACHWLAHALASGATARAERA